MDEGLGIAMDMSRGSWRRAPHVLFRHAADAQQPCCTVGGPGKRLEEPSRQPRVAAISDCV